MKLYVTASILALSIGTSASAQDAFQLGQITLFTNQTAISTARTGASVDVVESSDLNKAADIRLVDYLASLPGVSATTAGGVGGTGTLRVRGLGGQYLAVRIDGLDVTDASQTQTLFDWGTLTLSNVSRIELLKGSQSAAYGANAVGGVINITTLGASKEGTSGAASLEFGSFGTVQTALSLGLKADRLELALGINGLRTDGFSSLAVGTEADGAQSGQLTFAASYQVADDLKIGLSTSIKSSDSEYDPQFYADPTLSFSIPRGDGATFDERAVAKERGVRIFAELQTGAVRHEFSVSRFFSQRDFLGTETRLIEDYPPPNFTAVVVGNYTAGDGNFESQRDAVDYSGEWAVSESTQINFGAQWKREGFGATESVITTVPPAFTILNTSQDVTLGAVFGEVLYAPNEDVDLAFALRRDDHSVFGGKTTGRFGLAWRLREDIILRSSFSTGFRAPSLYELYSQTYGNPALQPENSRSFELGLEKRYGESGFVKATIFATEVSNRIDYDFNTNTYQQALGKTNLKGLELSGRAALSETVSFFGNYTLTDAISANGTALVRVPRHDLQLGVSADFSTHLSGQVSLNYVKDRFDGWQGAPVAVPDYTVVNLGMAYDLSDSVEAYFRVENLFNEQYQSVQNYNSSGRAAYFGVRASF